MNRYLITLTPTGRFFFGGDMTFIVGEKKEERMEMEVTQNLTKEEEERKLHNEKFSSYIIQSLTFPQQTSLLGMLRFLILSNDPEAFDSKMQKIKVKDKAKELIGAQSFGLTNKHKSGDFGEISSIGTCFLRHNDNCFFRAPVDYDLSVDTFEEGVTATLNGREISIPVIKKEEEVYTSKTGISYFYIDNNGNKKKKEDVFICDSRIGIRKNEKGKTEEGGFYKQIGYRMRDNAWQFAFVADIKNVDITQYNGQLVSVGADSSMFVFNAIVIEENKTEEPDLRLSQNTYLFQKEKNWERVALLSETYLEKEDLNKVRYAIADTKPFRFLSFNVEDEDYNVMRTIKKRSRRYNLYKAGSVFYFSREDAASFKANIDAKKEFVQIGYNKYIK